MRLICRCYRQKCISAYIKKIYIQKMNTLSQHFYIFFIYSPLHFFLQLSGTIMQVLFCKSIYLKDPSRSHCLIKKCLMIFCWLLNVQWQIFHAYSGRVKQLSKSKNCGMGQDGATVFDCHQKKEVMVRDEKFSLLQRHQPSLFRKLQKRSYT